MGDKTRMTELSRNDMAYVRPSPSRGTLGKTNNLFSTIQSSLFVTCCTNINHGIYYNLFNCVGGVCTRVEQETRQ